MASTLINTIKPATQTGRAILAGSRATMTISDQDNIDKAIDVGTLAADFSSAIRIQKMCEKEGSDLTVIDGMRVCLLLKLDALALVFADVKRQQDQVERDLNELELKR